jgi:hypothetical protein
MKVREIIKKLKKDGWYNKKYLETSTTGGLKKMVNLFLNL